MEIIQENFETRTCPKSTNFPLEVYGAVGSYMVGNQNLIICGGNDGSSKRVSDCYHFVDDKWKKMNNGLTTGRSSHGASLTSSDQMWITGGWNKGPLSSTNLIQQDGTITSGPQLPQPRYRHCQMSYNGTVIITGKF